MSSPPHKFIQADSVMSTPLKARSVSMITTSPPYYALRKYRGDGGLTWPDGWVGDLGLEPSPELYRDHLVLWGREMFRVLHPSGTLWLNLGDSYAGSGGAGGDYQEGGRREGQEIYAGTAKTMKSSYRRDKHPMPRQTGYSEYKNKDLFGIPWLIATALRASGWWLRTEIIWFKTNGMPESPDDRPTRNHETIFLFSKRPRYFYDQDAERTPLAESTIRRAGRGRSSDNKYETNAPGKTHALSQARDHVGGDRGKIEERINPLGANLRTVWQFPTGNYRGAHFATWPIQLAERMIKLGTPEIGICPTCREPLIPPDRNDPASVWTRNCKHSETPIPAVVLDPFSGSGTTIAAAARLGRVGIGLDYSIDYCLQGRERVGLDRWEDWDKGNMIKGSAHPIKNTKTDDENQLSFNLED